MVTQQVGSGIRAFSCPTTPVGLPLSGLEWVLDLCPATRHPGWPWCGALHRLRLSAMPVSPTSWGAPQNHLCVAIQVAIPKLGCEHTDASVDRS